MEVQIGKNWALCLKVQHEPLSWQITYINAVLSIRFEVGGYLRKASASSERCAINKQAVLTNFDFQVCFLTSSWEELLLFYLSKSI